MNYPTPESVVALAKQIFGTSAAIALKTPNSPDKKGTEGWFWELNVGPDAARENLATCDRLDQIEAFIHAFVTKRAA